jgi:hypothetical protein
MTSNANAEDKKEEDFLEMVMENVKNNTYYSQQRSSGSTTHTNQQQFERECDNIMQRAPRVSTMSIPEKRLVIQQLNRIGKALGHRLVSNMKPETFSVKLASFNLERLLRQFKRNSSTFKLNDEYRSQPKRTATMSDLKSSGDYESESESKGEKPRSGDNESESESKGEKPRSGSGIKIKGRTIYKIKR